MSSGLPNVHPLTKDAKTGRTLWKRLRGGRSEHRSSKLYRGWWIVIVGFLGQAITSGSTGWIFSILIRPMEQDLGWSRSELTGVLTVFSLISGTLSAPLGPMVDRYGSRLLMMGSALLGGACLMLVAFVDSPWQYYVAMGVGFGLAGSGLANLGPSAAIVNWFVKKRAAALTAASMGPPFVGIFVVPVIALLVSNVGWRMAWIVMGAAAWCIIPLAWLSIRRRPEDLGLLPDGDPPGTKEGAARVDVDAAPELAEPTWTVGEALRTRSFWLLVLAFVLIFLPASSILVHVAPYVIGKGLSVAVAAFTLTSYGFGGLAGRVMWGFLVSRLGLRRPLVSHGFAYGIGIFAFLLPASPLAFYAAAFFLGVTMSGWPVLHGQSFPDYFGRAIVGALTGVSGLFFMVSRAVAPLFAALVYDSTHSYVFAFSVFAVACFGASLACLLAGPPVRGRRPHDATAPSVRGLR